MVIFFEKPGCITNTRQKGLLNAAGYDVDARDLRSQDWIELNLRSFFGDLPVAEWFNKASPLVKSGEINPSSLSEEEAISMMVDNPMLIRRPLLQTDLGKGVGFEGDMLLRLGLQGADPVAGVEGCSHPKKAGIDPECP